MNPIKSSSHCSVHKSSVFARVTNDFNRPTVQDTLMSTLSRLVWTSSLLALLCAVLLNSPVNAQTDTRQPDRPSQRWLPLPKIQPNQVGEHQAELLHMLGQLMMPGEQPSSGGDKGNTGLTPEQLSSIEKTFDEWNRSTGGNFPSLDSIPREWIQEAMQNQALQSQARKLFDEYSKTRKLPLNDSDSSPSSQSNKTIDDLLKQFQQRNAQNNEERNRKKSPGSANAIPNRSLDSSRLRPASPAPDFLPPSSSDSPTDPTEQNTSPREDQPIPNPFDFANRNRNGREQPLDSSKTQPQQSNSGLSQGSSIRPVDPNRSANQSQLPSALPRQQNGAPPLSSRSDQRLDPSPLDSSPEVTNRYAPNSSPSNSSRTRPTSPDSTPGSTFPANPGQPPNLRSDSRRSEGSPNTSPQLNDKMREQIRSLFSQLAKQGAFRANPSSTTGNSELAQRDNSNQPEGGTERTLRDLANNRSSPGRGAKSLNSQPGRQASDSSRTPRESSRSGSQDRNPSPSAGTTRQRLSDLLRSQESDSSDKRSIGSQPGAGSPRELADGRSTTARTSEPLDLDELFSDESLSHLWDKNETGKTRTSSTDSSSSLTTGNIQDLLEAAREVRDSDIGRKIQKQFSKTPEERDRSSPNAGGAESGTDIKSQVERFGFGRTLQGIVERTLKDEGLKDGESIFSTPSQNDATSSDDAPGSNPISRTARKQTGASNVARKSQTELTRNRNQQPNAPRKKSSLEKLSDSFWAASKESSPQSANANTSNSRTNSGAQSNQTGSSWGLEGVSWEMGSSQWIVLIGICILLLVAWLLRTQVVGQAAALKKEVRWAKDKLRTGMTTRQDVVRAYHSLVLNRTSPASRWWTHRYVERKFAETLPQLQSSLRELTQVYELARYQPPEQELRTDQLATVQSALRELEAAGT
ncbi:MAG: hypothetical protein ACE361_12260 [Aureliella sp.]